MRRTTETASRILIVLEGPDGRRYATYELYPASAAFADLANTLDHARNHGLEPAPEKAPPAKVLAKK